MIKFFFTSDIFHLSVPLLIQRKVLKMYSTYICLLRYKLFTIFNSAVFHTGVVDHKLRSFSVLHCVIMREQELLKTVYYRLL